jgi:hypothetical protein
LCTEILQSATANSLEHTAFILMMEYLCEASPWANGTITKYCTKNNEEQEIRIVISNQEVREL